MKPSLLIIPLGLFATFLLQAWYVNEKQPCQDDSLECRLSWISEYLSLTDEQYAAVLNVHLDHEAEVSQLSQKIHELQSHITQLENNRVNNDSIDFIAFYNYLQEKTSLSKISHTKNQDFISDIGSVMNSDQEEKFKYFLNDFISKTPPTSDS